MSQQMSFTSPSPELVLKDTIDFSPVLSISDRPMSTVSGNGDAWMIPFGSMSPEFENGPVSTELLWRSWSGVRRTRSISEAELAFASEANVPLYAAVVGEPGSPVQLPPPPIAALRRSLTLPPRLHPDRHLDFHRRKSSVEDFGFIPNSPFVEEESDELVVELQRQLDERDAKMREISEEAMFSVSQLHELTAIVMEMKTELDSLKAENDRLQRLVEQDGDSPATVLPHPTSSASKVDLRRTKASGVVASVGFSRADHHPDGQEVT